MSAVRACCHELVGCECVLCRVHRALLLCTPMAAMRLWRIRSVVSALSARHPRNCAHVRACSQVLLVCECVLSIGNAYKQINNYILSTILACGRHAVISVTPLNRCYHTRFRFGQTPRAPPCPPLLAPPLVDVPSSAFGKRQP